MHESEKSKWSRSVMSNSLRPHGLQPTRLLHPWDFPGKSTGVGCYCLLLDSILKSRDITLPTKVYLVKAMIFLFFQLSCMDVRVGPWRKLSAKELMLLNHGAGEDFWESLGLQGDQPVNTIGNQLWIFIGRNDAKAEAPILCPPDWMNWLIGRKTLMLGKTEGREKGTTEDEMVG